MRPSLGGLSRLIWRLRRQVASMRATPPTGPGIERFSIFQGRLRIRGVLDLPAPVTSLTLETAAGDAAALRFEQRPGQVAIDDMVELRADPREAAGARLVARLSDGSQRVFEDLGTGIGDPVHELSSRFQHLLRERPPGRMLEVGSRARSGLVRRDWAPPGWDYSGFDILKGPNVDVVGDAHALAQHYEPAQFDAVMAFSVLEHLLMPWKFVLELNRVLRPGAIGLFSTHQCWPLHDEPWDFWRFSDTAWTALLNPATGFEIIAARTGEPAYIVAKKCSPATAFYEHPTGALASMVLFRKTGETRLEWPVELAQLIDTRYPGGVTAPP